MSSISKIVEREISSSPFLEESIAEDLINISSLARKLKPKIERELGKPVKSGAIVMAINRLEFKGFASVNDNIAKFLANLGDIIIRSNLNNYTFKNSSTLSHAQMKLMEKVSEELDGFCTFSQGIYETTVITGSNMEKVVEKYFANENLIEKEEKLSSVTVRLPNFDVPGSYYYILKQVAWENINVSEIISTTNEMTLAVKDDDIDRIFSVLMRLKKRNQ